MSTLIGTTFGRMSGGKASLLKALRRMIRIYNERQSLANLDDRMLRDIGVTRRQALEESVRVPWDI